MKKLRWQIVIILVTALIAGILLVSQQPASQPTSSKPTKGGTYTEALVGSLMRLNPVLAYHNTADQDVNRLLYSGLVRFDSNGNPQADLAESWGYSKDGTIYNFSLRTDAKWHDGQPVTADDVAFTVDLMRSDNSYVPEDLRNFWKEVEVVVLDKTTLQFKLPEAFAPFLDYMTFGVLPKHLLSSVSMDQMPENSFNLKPVGSGPFKLDYLIVEEGQIKGVVLTAFEDYYGSKPYIQQVVFRYYPDSNAAMQAYRDGEVMGVSQVSGDSLMAALAEPGLSLYTGRLPQLSMVLFNLNNADVAFLQDANLRRGLLQGLNRQWMIDHVLNGQAVLADGPIMPDTWAYFSELERVAFDRDTAAQTLKDAGYSVPADATDGILQKDGKALSFQLMYPDDDTHAALAQAIASDWEKLGVKVELAATPYDTLVGDSLANRTYQAALVDLNLSGSPDPDPYPFWDMAQATGGQNYSQWDSRTASEYLEQARVTVDQGERARLYRNFQVIFQKEMPALPLFYPVYSYAVSNQIQGVQIGPLFSPSDRFANVTDWFINASRGGNEAPAETTNP